MNKNYTIQYFEAGYGGSFPISNYYLDTFGKLPNTINYGNTFGVSLLDKLNSSPYLENIHKADFIDLQGGNSTSTRIFKSKQHGKFLVILFDIGDSKIMNIQIYYDTKDEISFLEEIINKETNSDKSSSIGLILKDDIGLTIRDFDISAGKTFDISTNYNDDFKEINSKIINNLSKKDKNGLVLLHGKPGTGKTTYIKHLCGKLNKQIIFVPPMMSIALADPGFIPFLMRHPNSVLIIEDAENIVKDRSLNVNSDAVSNILNITDGILGECLNIQIIATFNTDRTQIDEALTRKGRLLAEYKFEELTKKKTNKLLKKLGNKETVDKALSLADIYNYTEEPSVNNNKPGIGFFK